MTVSWRHMLAGAGVAGFVAMAGLSALGQSCNTCAPVPSPPPPPPKTGCCQTPKNLVVNVPGVNVATANVHVGATSTAVSSANEGAIGLPGLSHLIPRHARLLRSPGMTRCELCCVSTRQRPSRSGVRRVRGADDNGEGELSARPDPPITSAASPKGRAQKLNSARAILMNGQPRRRHDVANLPRRLGENPGFSRSPRALAFS